MGSDWLAPLCTWMCGSCKLTVLFRNLMMSDTEPAPQYSITICTAGSSGHWQRSHGYTHARGNRQQSLTAFTQVHAHHWQCSHRYTHITGSVHTGTRTSLAVFTQVHAHHWQYSHRYTHITGSVHTGTHAHGATDNWTAGQDLSVQHGPAGTNKNGQERGHMEH